MTMVSVADDRKFGPALMARRLRPALGGVAAMGVAMVALPSVAAAKCQVAQFAELKVTMVGDKPMIDTGINGRPARFVADSGAFYSVISPGTAAALGLKLTPAPASFRLRGLGGDTSASIATVKEFTLAGVPLRNIQFIVGGSDIGAGAGVLGQNVLGIADVEYDLQHGAVRLMRATDCRTTNLAYWANGKPVSMLPIDVRSPENPHTIGTVTINGRKVRAVFDTGAAGTILSLAAARRAGITPDSPGVTPAGSGRGFGTRLVRTWIAPIDSIAIGDGEEVRRTKLRIGEIDLGNADMLIGADFFLSHRVYVANADHRLFFTYDGGAIFNLTPSRVIAADGSAAAPLPTDATPEPTDAEGFSRRGASFAARQQFDKAIADFSRAMDLAPTESRYPDQRAMAYLALRKPALAMADLDRTLTLRPAAADARIVRARLRLARRDRAGALEDLDAAAKSEPPSASTRLAIGGLYNSAAAPDAAIAQFDLWLAAHREDSSRPIALNGRCWARAQLGRDLDKALTDCNAALRARPGTASYLDSRGLVYLRSDAPARAIADYDAALAVDPRIAWSLYGRGLAERRQGLAARGDADVAAALAVDPGLADRAKALGITR